MGVGVVDEELDVLAMGDSNSNLRGVIETVPCIVVDDIKKVQADNPSDDFLAWATVEKVAVDERGVVDAE